MSSTLTRKVVVVPQKVITNYLWSGVGNIDSKRPGIPMIISRYTRQPDVTVNYTWSGI